MSLIILFFLFLYLTVIIQDSTAQVSQQWVSRYNGPGNGADYSIKTVTDDSGNVYVAGFSASTSNGYDYATIKYNSAGVQQWIARYNGPGSGDDFAQAMVVDGFGNVYVTGYSSGNGSGFDYATIKYNSSGIQQWVARYNGSANGDDQACSIALDVSGNIYVTGTSYRDANGNDFATIMYNSSGVQQWIQRYHNSNWSSIAVAMSIDRSGNIYVAGTVGYGFGFAEYAAIKISSSGVQQWAQLYSATQYTSASCMAVDDSGNVCVSGYCILTPDKDVMPIVKFSTTGVQQWAQIFQGPNWNSHDRAFNLAFDRMGYLYVCGANYSVIKYSPSGAQQWVQRTSSPSSSANSIAIDNTGNVYVTGFIYNDPIRDYSTTKFDASGVQKWVQIYNGPANANDIASSIAIDSLNNVYITGYSTGNASNYDFATIKYSQLTGINPISFDIPKSYSLTQNYPNPFNPSTKIKFGVLKNGNVHLVIYDAIGREVATLVNEQLNAGTYEAEWNASNFPSGVYFYKLISGDFSETKKLILIK